MQADAHSDVTMDRLTRDARAVAASVRGVLGVEPGDLVSAGWLAYVEAQSRGLGHAGCAQRARFAMIDEVRGWIGTPFDHGKGAPQVTFVPLAEALPTEQADTRRTRSRLPRRVRSALKRLSPRAREVLTALYVHGWSVSLVAEAYNITAGTVCNARTRGLQQLCAAVGASSDIRRCASPTYGSTGLATGSSNPQRRATSSSSAEF